MLSASERLRGITTLRMLRWRGFEWSACTFLKRKKVFWALIEKGDLVWTFARDNLLAEMFINYECRSHIWTVMLMIQLMSATLHCIHPTWILNFCCALFVGYFKSVATDWQINSQVTYTPFLLLATRFGPDSFWKAHSENPMVMNKYRVAAISPRTVLEFVQSSTLLKSLIALIFGAVFARFSNATKNSDDNQWMANRLESVQIPSGQCLHCYPSYSHHTRRTATGHDLHKRCALSSLTYSRMCHGLRPVLFWDVLRPSPVHCVRCTHHPWFCVQLEFMRNIRSNLR